MVPTGDAPVAVLLDAGGVFVLPDADRILEAFTRAECSVPRGVLADAHYRAAARFGIDRDVEGCWAETWLDYLQTYVDECGVPQDRRDEAHRHLDSELADAALWVDPVPGSRDGLRALADTGVRLGIISNADGMMGSRLAQLELCQVGPGIGVEIECVVDSGNVGVMKPDPRIFQAPSTSSSWIRTRSGTSVICLPSTSSAPVGPGSGHISWIHSAFTSTPITNGSPPWRRWPS